MHIEASAEATEAKRAVPRQSEMLINNNGAVKLKINKGLGSRHCLRLDKTGENGGMTPLYSVRNAH